MRGEREGERKREREGKGRDPRPLDGRGGDCPFLSLVYIIQIIGKGGAGHTAICFDGIPHAFRLLAPAVCNPSRLTSLVGSPCVMALARSGLYGWRTHRQNARVSSPRVLRHLSGACFCPRIPACAQCAIMRARLRFVIGWKERLYRQTLLTAYPKY